MHVFGAELEEEDTGADDKLEEELEDSGGADDELVDTPRSQQHPGIPGNVQDPKHVLPPATQFTASIHDNGGVQTVGAELEDELETGGAEDELELETGGAEDELELETGGAEDEELLTGPGPLGVPGPPVLFGRQQHRLSPSSPSKQGYRLSHL